MSEGWTTLRVNLPAAEASMLRLILHVQFHFPDSVTTTTETRADGAQVAWGPLAVPEQSRQAERRVERLEYLFTRLAATQPDCLPEDGHRIIADIVREVKDR